MMPPDHSYQFAFRRLMRLFEYQLDGGTPAEVVARSIYDAVQEGGAKLRYPVGPDAEALIQARDRLSASEWVELLTEPDEERFVARASEVFGADLYNSPSFYHRLTAAGSAVGSD
jgi:hypothetical protein